ncbi:MAG: ABC transporter ATP-binding protein [Acidobacteriia bacterium]|nr:ABC transporter ATP-binding protein [Terriglobia bacterium]
MSATPPLLSVDISAGYPGKPLALDGVRFTVAAGEILGLIGESGSGKSTIALALLRLLELRGGEVRGSIRFGGRDLMSLSRRELRSVRGKEMAIVLQSPVAALNPALRLETQLREAWRAHRDEPWSEGREHARGLLLRMGLPAEDRFLRRYPRQLSVGQAQRVVIAMAVMHGPRLLIADEPTSALDPGSAGEILELFRGLNREFGTAILYVSHDLRSVAALCHTVAVLRHGRLADRGPAKQMLGEPGSGCEDPASSLAEALPLAFG